MGQEKLWFRCFEFCENKIDFIICKINCFALLLVYCIQKMLCPVKIHFETKGQNL